MCLDARRIMADGAEQIADVAGHCGRCFNFFDCLIHTESVMKSSHSASQHVRHRVTHRSNDGSAVVGCTNPCHDDTYLKYPVRIANLDFVYKEMLVPSMSGLFGCLQQRVSSWLCQLVLLLFLISIPQGIAGGSEEFFKSQPNADPYYVKESTPGPLIMCSVHDQYAQEPYHLNWIHIDSDPRKTPRIITTDRENRMPDLYELDQSSCSGCYNLRVNTVSYDRDNGRFSCQIQGPQDFLQQSRDAVLTVLVRPSAPIISSQPPGPIQESRLAEVTCESVGGSPPPRIDWRFSNGTQVHQGITVVNATNLDSPTKSTLRWDVSADDNAKSLVCSVSNKAMDVAESALEARTEEITVHYPPKVSVGPVPAYNVEKGTTAKLVCRADANPKPSRYFWTQTSGLASNSYTEAVVDLPVRKDSGGNYTCTVSNSVGQGAASMELNVFFAPEITVQKDVTVREGDSLKLSCFVDANPVPTKVQWRGPAGSFEGEVMEVDSMSKRQGGNYTCSATNQMDLHEYGLVRREGSGSTNVIVQYPPSKAIVSIVEPAVVGGTAKLKCFSEDPGVPVAEYRWRGPAQTDYEYNARDVYTISNVQLTNAGEYWCQPQNSIGMGPASSLRLVVHEPAHLVHPFLSTEKEAKAGDTGILISCAASGHPAPNITWYKDGELLSQEMYGDHWSIGQTTERQDCESAERCSYKVTGSLQWKDGVNWNDKGQYTCHSFNGAGTPAESSMIFKVSHKPVIVNNPNIPSVAADIGSSALIECKTSARPAPSFRWFFNGVEITNDYTRYDFADERNASHDAYSQILTVRTARDQDLGNYRCLAYNEFGNSSYTFKLQTRSKPSAPTDVRRLTGGHNWIELGWLPGFDGGYNQEFTVEMRGTDGQQRIFNSSQNGAYRLKRQVGYDTPRMYTYNVTGLNPLQTYEFRVKAYNRIGESQMTDWTRVQTTDAPLDPRIQTPEDVKFNRKDELLQYSPKLDPKMFCVQVYVDKDGSSWSPWDCVPPQGSVLLGGAGAQAVKVRYCVKETMVCSQYKDAELIEEASALSDVMIGVIVAVAVLLIIGVVACICCLRTQCCNRCKGGTKAAPQKAKTISNPSSSTLTSNGVKKEKKKSIHDYEMETNQNRPKAISNPYLPDKTPPETHGSKDSGVFTTTGSVNNYHVDAAGGWDNGGFGIQPTSYDENLDNLNSWQDGFETQDGYGYDQGYGTQISYNDGSHGYNPHDPNAFVDPNAHLPATSHTGMHHPYGQHGGPMMNNGGNQGYMGGSYDPISSYPDPYGVEMHPGGGMGDAASVQSGYSTPSATSQRRVIREIIV